MRKRAASFVDKEKGVLITVAEKIGSTLGQAAALAEVAKKASRESKKPARRHGLKRTARAKSASKTMRVRRAARSKAR